MTEQELLNIPVSINYTDIFNDLMERKASHVDHTVGARQLRRVDENVNTLAPRATRGHVTFSFQSYSDLERRTVGEFLHFSPHAESMLLTRHRVPAGYFHRCPYHLQVPQINYWLEHSKQTLYLRSDRTGRVRAVFGKRFKPGLDDHLAVPIFIDSMEKQQGADNGQMVISGYDVDSSLTYVKTLLTKLHVEYNNTLARGGVALINSEIGCSALHIRPIVHHRRYFRWLDFYAGKGGCTSLRHTRDLPRKAIEMAVEKAVEACQAGIQRLFETMHEEVRHPARDLKKILDSSTVLTGRILDGLMEDYEIKELTTKYQIAEDILLACKDLPLFKQHVVKVEVGRYLNLFGADEARMDAIFDD